MHFLQLLYHIVGVFAVAVTAVALKKNNSASASAVSVCVLCVYSRSGAGSVVALSLVWMNVVDVGCWKKNL